VNKEPKLEIVVMQDVRCCDISPQYLTSLFLQQVQWTPPKEVTDNGINWLMGSIGYWDQIDLI
jgi:hypothetical protein